MTINAVSAEVTKSDPPASSGEGKTVGLRKVSKEKRLVPREHGKAETACTWPECLKEFQDKLGDDEQARVVAKLVWNQCEYVEDDEEESGNQSASGEVTDYSLGSLMDDRGPRKKSSENTRPPKPWARNDRARRKETLLGVRSDDERRREERDKDEYDTWEQQFSLYLYANNMDSKVCTAMWELPESKQRVLVSKGHFVNHDNPSAGLWRRHVSLDNGYEKVLDDSYIICKWCGVGNKSGNFGVYKLR